MPTLEMPINSKINPRQQAPARLIIRSSAWRTRQRLWVTLPDHGPLKFILAVVVLHCFTGAFGNLPT